MGEIPQEQVCPIKAMMEAEQKVRDAEQSNELYVDAMSARASTLNLR